MTHLTKFYAFFWSILLFIIVTISIGIGVLLPSTLHSWETFKESNLSMINVTRTLSKTVHHNTKSINESVATLDDCFKYRGHYTSLEQNFSCFHFITGARFGRTGNQLFQIAALLATAMRHGYIPIIKQSHPLAYIFDLPNLSNIEVVNSVKFKEKKCCSYSKEIENLDHSRNWTLAGYFQSWKYFAGKELMLRRVFKLKSHFVEEAKAFLKNVSIPGYSNICLHNRRGDFVSRAERGKPVADDHYINASMNYYKNDIGSVQFIILSDDISWCKRHIRGQNIVYSPFSMRAGTDMALMTLCDHVIITSGTFGWWGAWLGGHQAVYFKGYPAPGSDLESKFNRSEYYLNDWIGL